MSDGRPHRATRPLYSAEQRARRDRVRLDAVQGVLAPLQFADLPREPRLGVALSPDGRRRRPRRSSRSWSRQSRSTRS